MLPLTNFEIETKQVVKDDESSRRIQTGEWQFKCALGLYDRDRRWGGIKARIIPKKHR